MRQGEREELGGRGDAALVRRKIHAGGAAWQTQGGVGLEAWEMLPSQPPLLIFPVLLPCLSIYASHSSHRSSAATLGEPRSPHFTDGRASWLPGHFSYSRSAVLHKPRVARAESCALVPNWSPGFCRVDGATSDWSPPRQYSPSELAAPPDLYKRNGLTDLIFPNASYIVEGPFPL